MDRSTQQTLLATTAVTGFLTAFSMSGANVALEQIASELQLSAVAISWVTLSVILGTGALLMPGARVADFWGRKRAYNVGLAAFALFCCASAVAPNGAVLIATRVLQGAAAALVFPSTIAMVTLAYPAETRGRALGLQVAGVYLGITLGPVLGGIITENLGWRALFLVVGGLSVVNQVLPLRRLRGLEWRETKAAPFDVRGSVVWVLPRSRPSS